MFSVRLVWFKFWLYLTTFEHTFENVQLKLLFTDFSVFNSGISGKKKRKIIWIKNGVFCIELEHQKPIIIIKNVSKFPFCRQTQP